MGILPIVLASLLLQPAGEKLLIIHADDLGNAHATNVAAIEMLDADAVSSASIMMPCAWVNEIADYARKHPDKDLGLHLTLTSEWKHMRWAPVASKDRVPGLLDPNGYLWPSVAEVAQRATAAEVEIELRAQIELARKLGIRFTHLDTHMGTLYARVDYVQVFEKLGKEYGVPILRLKPTDAAIARAQPDVRKYLLDQEERIQKEGHPRLDALLDNAARGTKTYEERRAAYHKALRELQPGLYMMILHPAVLGPETQAMTGTARDRDADYRIFMEPATKQLIKELGIRTIGWKEAAGKQ